MESTLLILGALALLTATGIAFFLKGHKPPELPPSLRPQDNEREATKELDLHDDAILGAEEIGLKTEHPGPVAPMPPSLRPGSADFETLKTGLQSTRGNLISRLAGIFKKNASIDAAVLEEVEEVLITADVGVKTTQKILAGMTERVESGSLITGEQAWAAIREMSEEILAGSGHDLEIDNKPTVVLVAGVNGVGKTTTIGKLASRLKKNERSLLLAAGDTFRAAAVTQLEVWGRRVGCEVVRGADRADPSSVIFEAIKQAKETGIDCVICDTAGRLHTKAPLMDELKKIGRTVEKALGRPADHVLLVLDATTGQNAVQQAEIFKEALPINGIVLTKLDGTAKGGVILGIVDQHGVPIRYIGVGERVEDLRPFHAGAFLDALFDLEGTEEAAD